MPVYFAYRQHIEKIFQHALDAVDPLHLVRRSFDNASGDIRADGGKISLDNVADLYIIAFGKAAGGMTRAFLASMQTPVKEGIIAHAATGDDPVLSQFKVFLAGHPHPTQASIDAGEAARVMLGKTGPDDLLVVLISGGGSALIELPIPGLSLEDLQTLNQQLLASGLSITVINIIRSALSQLKAGGLARLAYPARVLSLIMSDVVGDRLGSIASGPTVLMPDQRRKARQLVQARGLWSELAQPIRDALDRPAPLRRRARRPVNLLIGGNRDLIDAAAAGAGALGYHPVVLNRHMVGEARKVGENFASRLVQQGPKTERPTCFIMGGETTVTVRGSGIGGRNQELALAAAHHLAGHGNLAVASLASDGIDGPTDAAGAIVDGETWARIKSKGMDPEDALLQNNSYTALQCGNALHHTGPTGTNVADLVLGLVYPHQGYASPPEFDPPSSG